MMFHVDSLFGSATSAKLATGKGQIVRKRGECGA